VDTPYSAANSAKKLNDTYAPDRRLLCTAYEVMAIQLGLSEFVHRKLGMRHTGDRRHGDRRAALRTTPERRSRDRRRARLRGLLFSALAIVLPHHKFSMPRVTPSVARVSTSENSFVAVSPEHAYDAIIREAAELYKVDVALIRSVVQAESSFNPLALSRVGAMGLMQLMPSTADALDVVNPFDPRENIMAGTRLLKDLLKRHKGNIALTLASYNAGPGNVARYRGRVPPFKETRKYVKRITGLIADAKQSGDD
jgi:soluble lytic murein transglycosylase-like protein